MFYQTLIWGVRSHEHKACTHHTSVFHHSAPFAQFFSNSGPFLSEIGMTTCINSSKLIVWHEDKKLVMWRHTQQSQREPARKTRNITETNLNQRRERKINPDKISSARHTSNYILSVCLWLYIGENVNKLGAIQTAALVPNISACTPHLAWHACYGLRTKPTQWEILWHKNPWLFNNSHCVLLSRDGN